ncbi:dihydroneopterin aldolase [uncultured Litoreibacter sp.]|uniref:dihydroneopterin aldolase n=1 Tax=uncultured Litoreibacter sp. TaxID=1392394 RepID=UPI0026391B8B|nr:dihydroneopterin aldolase [uncultured Litoreibacter sp.]
MTSEIRLAFAHPSERSEAMADEPRDRISLRDHIREVEIGAFQAERGTTQRICFNIVVEVRLPDGLDDDVDRIMSYDTITEAIDRELSSERLNLLETLAERVAEDILIDPRAARVFVRIEKLDRGPGALGVEIVRDRDMVSLVEPEDEVQPLVAYLGNDICVSDDLGGVLDRLEGQGLPLILCVGMGDTAAPKAAHPAAQRRIDLLAIEQNAWVLAGRDKRCVVVATRTELDWAMKNGQISVWAPSKIVLDATDGPDLSEMDAAALTDWFAQEFGAKGTISLGEGLRAPGTAMPVSALLAGDALPL